MEKLIISPSPHIHSSNTTARIMWDVIIALMPAVAVAVWFYGLHALMLVLVCTASCVLTEILISRFLMHSDRKMYEPSAALTGILLALNLPPAAPWWIGVVGSIVAIGIAKMTFGGLGQNIFNPALVGRVFLLVSFPVIMTDWAFTQPLCDLSACGGLSSQIDAYTGATHLGVAKVGLGTGATLSQIFPEGQFTWDMALLRMGGCIGELSAVALLIGFVYLLCRRVIKVTIPFTIIGTVALVSWIFSTINPELYTGPLFNIFTGGLLLGSIFMATDYVTSPMTTLGQIIYGVGIGLIMIFIRYFGSYPEGMSFSILIMNCAVPLINKYCKPRRFAKEAK